MADALIGTTETAAVSEIRIDSTVQSYLIQQAKLLPLVSDFSSLATPGVKSISLPKSGGFTVGAKSENTALDAQIVTYSTDSVALTTHNAVQFLIEDYASREAKPGVLSDMLMKASKDMAYSVDGLIAAQLLDASTSSPDHVIDFNDGTNNDVELADVLNIRALLQAQNLPIEECYIGLHPAKEKEMLAISSFIDASQWGNNEPISNGVIGKIYGLKVVISNVFENDSMVAWHPSAVAFAWAQQTRVQSAPDLAQLGMRYSLDYICGCTEVDSGKRQVLVEPHA